MHTIYAYMCNLCIHVHVQSMFQFQPSEGCIREAVELGDDGRHNHNPAALNRTSGFRPEDPSQRYESEVRIAKYYSHIYVLLYTCVIQRLLVDIACDMVLILPPFQHWWNVKGNHRCRKMLTERMGS